MRARNRQFLLLASLLVVGMLFFARGPITGFLTKNVGEEGGYKVVDFPVKYEKTLNGKAYVDAQVYDAVANFDIELVSVPSNKMETFEKVLPSGTAKYLLASWDGWGASVKGSVTYNGKEYLIDSLGSSSSFSSTEFEEAFSNVFVSQGITLGVLNGATLLELTGSNSLRAEDGLPRLNGNEKVSFKITGPVTVELS